ncbi:MAG: sigma-70 family RNA polymerase sigma factor [Planctomycetes bacterium]|nr:sigma-70 family RNA polymerase sigma factor [Planctomycetota bacterium]NOG56056.1 sigma-70 family RNA polymerase sigma factor [Planctomycetota bacterium]
MDGQAEHPNSERINQWIVALYPELKRIASSILNANSCRSPTLRPTAVVNEAYIKLCNGRNKLNIETQAQFLALAATVIRRFLCSHIRKRTAQKRGGKGARCLVLADTIEDARQPMIIDILILDEALGMLKRQRPRYERVAVMKIFAGMSDAHISTYLGVSPRTVSEDWHYAKGWIANHLSADGERAP